MSDLVRDAYDVNAALYASLFLSDLEHDAQSRRCLASLAELAAGRRGPIADLGCGPGSVVNHLSQRGVAVFGLDLSQGQIDQARQAFPGLDFEVGDLTALRCPDASLGGIVSRYSLIHLPPASLRSVFDEWVRVLEPEAPLFVSFFGSRAADAHGEPFDHKVATAYELFPAVIAGQLEASGFVEVVVEATPIPEGGRPFDHVSILARKSAPGRRPQATEVVALT